ncbi:hypothetical protein GH714_000878 [Hevea brasiliensis]|uniref:EGF-like domain-containing protein n=1 Tax=Hevea brasiliensis TaxID=3981 RepID=A0A6A6L5F6_HEVBR|nr:hypothetical protein GH714_000878 [Hevea brasiliensis]
MGFQGMLMKFVLIDDCYLDPEFLITCNETFDPPRAFLTESRIIVREITLDGKLHIITFVSRDCYNTNSGRAADDNTSWSMLRLSKFVVSDTDNMFVAIGCNTEATVLGSLALKHSYVYKVGCISMCKSLEYVPNNTCSGIDIDECKNSTLNNCDKICIKTPGSFHCSCPEGYHGDGIKNGTGSGCIRGRSLVIRVTVEGKRSNFEKKDLPKSFTWTRSVNEHQSSKNKFTVVGCDSYAYLRGFRQGKPYSAGCMSTCDSLDYVYNKSCAGSGCCQIEIPDGLYSVNVTARSFNNHTGILDFSPCTYAFIVEDEKFNFSSQYLKNIPQDKFPVILEWSIDNTTNKEASRRFSSACGHNATSYRPDNVPGYRCRCEDGYDGNPYLGCQGVSIGFLVLLVAISWIFLFIRQRRLKELKEKFFQKNGGLILQQKLSMQHEIPDIFKIFTAEELKEATNNYDDSTIVGRGGFGTVYKGILADNREVAIKKSIQMHPWVEVSTEETEYLLAREESFTSGHGNGCIASSAGFDSIKDHLVVSVGGGR